MKLHYLRYFVALAKELHFGRAAKKLSITQPPLSNAIKGLEEELGVKLFTRDSKHVELTQTGQTFLAECRVILEKIDQATENAKLVDSGQVGRLKIGITGSLIYREIPQLVNAFSLRYPDIRVQLTELSTAEQIERLHQGRIDAGFMNEESTSDSLLSIDLPRDDLIVCLPASHPSAHLDSIDLFTLRLENFLMFSREAAPANYDNVIAALSRQGVHPQVSHEARQWLMIVAMVANDLGVSLVPRSLAKSQVSGVKFIPFRGESVATAAKLAWNPVHQSPALRTFVGYAREQLPAAPHAAIL